VCVLPFSRLIAASLGAVLLASAAFAQGTDAVPGGAEAAIERTEITVEAAIAGPLPLTVFRAPGDAPRPAVLILHGAGGLAVRVDGYEHYARKLAEDGFDAYVFTYYTGDDEAQRDAGVNIFLERFAGWTQLVSDIARHVVAEPHANGKVGLVGFSNGGILAAGAGANTTQFGAAVVYYGAYPAAIEEITSFPPLLVLHGISDSVIPVSYGMALSQQALTLGGSSELVIYPGTEHGFGLETEVGDGADAYERTVTFLKERLQP
jgi:carboxymethylenebutenolidase